MKKMMKETCKIVGGFVLQVVLVTLTLALIPWVVMGHICDALVEMMDDIENNFVHPYVRDKFHKSFN